MIFRRYETKGLRIAINNGWSGLIGLGLGLGLGLLLVLVRLRVRVRVRGEIGNLSELCVIPGMVQGYTPTVSQPLIVYIPSRHAEYSVYTWYVKCI